MSKFITVGSTLVNVACIISIKDTIDIGRKTPCVEVRTTGVDRAGDPLRFYADGTVADLQAANPAFFAAHTL